ncbi:MAG: acylphosphatase [Enterovibrio sp.]
MDRICAKAVVSGKVQGVGFRFQTAHRALQLGLTGYAKNEDNGEVTVLICGEKAQVTAMLEWLTKGPASATVTSMRHELLEWYFVKGFAIK